MTAEILFRKDPYLQRVVAKVTYSGPEGIKLDRTNFYPLGGGQPGDEGYLQWLGHEVAITDTRKWKAEGEPDDVLHLLSEGSPRPQIGDNAEVSLNWSRRYAHMRMHTCMHLLSALLREGAVTGGQVGAEKSRLDFDLPSGSIDKDELTVNLNRLIQEDHIVSELWISDAELEAQPELVRTMSVKPPMGHGQVRLLKIGANVDLQPCGGTHVKRTSEIGSVEVTKIENKGKQNRRVIVAFRNVAEAETV